MNEISSIEKIQLIHQTLDYLITDKPDKIDSYLIELEGDYYTFFHPDFLSKLCTENHISKSQKTGLACLHNLIGKIEADKWNTHAFLNDPEWVFIRETAQALKKLMKNGKFQ